MNKKTIIMVVSILISSILIGSIVGVIVGKNAGGSRAIISSTSDTTEVRTAARDKVKITDNETKSIGFETYDNGLVSMQVPEGWRVTVHPGADSIHYTFMIENPQDSNYRIYFNMKTEGYLSSKKERSWYASLYPTTPFAQLPFIDPQTTEQFYKIFTKAARLSDSGGFVSPTINDFTPIETLGSNTTGGEILRANYTDENGNTVDGIFTATIMPVSLYYVTALNVYNTVFFTAPEGKLTDWEGILNYCVGTINFSNSFVTSFYNQEQIISQTSASIARIAGETSDIITSGWNSRQSTYDVISQKQSDATLGYERVYDTQTGEIYKAYEGFTDYDWNGRYKSVTDDMYNLPTSGYIERAD